MSYDKEKINKDNSVSDTDAELDVVDDAEFVLSDKMEYEGQLPTTEIDFSRGL